MARHKKKLRSLPKPVVFIACEGTLTEYDYFDRWGQDDDVLSIFENVIVYPDIKEETNYKTDPVGLVNEAIARLQDKSCDYAWVVFDKDGHANLERSFIEADQNGVKVAFSSRSIEEWVLMHFEKNDTAFQVTQCKSQGKAVPCGTPGLPGCIAEPCLSGYIRRNGYIPDYEKADIYLKTISRLNVAMINAAWLRWRVNASLNLPQPALHLLNPYTNVDQLILFLQDKKETVEWGCIDEEIVIKQWNIYITTSIYSIIVRLSHSFQEHRLINQVFCNNSFMGVDGIYSTTPLICTNRQLILNENGSTLSLLSAKDILELTFPIVDLPYLLFADPDFHLRLFIEL